LSAAERAIFIMINTWCGKMTAGSVYNNLNARRILIVDLSYGRLLLAAKCKMQCGETLLRRFVMTWAHVLLGAESCAQMSNEISKRAVGSEQCELANLLRLVDGIDEISGYGQ